MGGDLTINDIKLAAYDAHIQNFAPLMTPLKHLNTKLDNKAADYWNNVAV